MRFELATAGRIVFGAPLHEIGAELLAFEGPFLMVTGRDPERAAPLRLLLEERGQTAVLFPIGGEPTLSTARDGARLAGERGCRTVIGLGGGSVLDAGKAIAAFVTN